jgi:hypothetical protein
LVATFYSPDGRDDVSLAQTTRCVLDHLQGNGHSSIAKRVGSTSQRDELDPQQFDKYLKQLRDLVMAGEAALSCDDLDNSVRLWQSVFGSSFGTLGGKVTPADRGWQLRRVLEDFEGLSIRRANEIDAR